MRLKNTAKDHAAKNQNCGDPSITNVKIEERTNQINETRDADLIRSNLLNENRVLNLKLQTAHQTYDQNFKHLTEALRKMEQNLHYQQIRTCAAEHSLAVEKLETKRLYKK
ncbi:hypothetical protein DPEC_G00186270 [Dallia pectoralis]|uniref:Uncharacterized protein n=1 Tax=Dallia pectoralis TaxID=75939 RepID=A0ACC2GC25_DALPE|nr:hypothetical protein DPEC_G00186270 [Dallia pectoralis]